MASTATTVPSPPNATAIPPSGEPISRAIDDAALLAEFAVTSCSAGTILVTIANDAGLLICANKPWIAATTNAGQIRS